MPQIILECSNNVIEKDSKSLLLQIHHILTENLPTELRSCKSRVIRHHDFVLGDGNEDNAFVHLSIGVMKGRSHELLSAVASTIMTALKDAFSLSLTKLNLQITLAIQDLPAVYEKYSSPIH